MLAGETRQTRAGLVEHLANFQLALALALAHRTSILAASSTALPLKLNHICEFGCVHVLHTRDEQYVE